MRKVIKIIVFVLTLVILFEIGFYFWVTKTSLEKAEELAQSQFIVAPDAPTAYPLPTLSYVPAFDNRELDLLKTVRKNGHVSSKIDHNFEDGVLAINSEGGTFTTGYVFRAGIDLKGGNKFLFTEKEYEMMKVYEQTGSGNKTINFSDLKVDDTIMIHMVVDLVKVSGQNIESLEITKLQQ